ncbi:MAG: polysaccharide biosynthesis protein, partial [Deltaproteobacteria bacterium]|nr:polysaccharide biosynthesis protein [Deltaproteobacteria bacterium]
MKLGINWRKAKRVIQFGMDLFVLSSAFLIAYLLRFDFELSEISRNDLLAQLPYVVALQMTALYLMRVHTIMWRYVGLRELSIFGRAAILSAVPLLLIRFFLPTTFDVWKVPLSITLMDTLIAFGGIVGARVLRRIIHEGSESRLMGPSAEQSRIPVLLVGAGRAGVIAARELNSVNAGLRVMGFVDDDKQKLGLMVHGVRVVGTTEDLPEIVERMGIDHVVITIATASGGEIRRIKSLCDTIPIKVRIIPNLREILQGEVEISRIRDVELEDLLGRDPVCLEESTLSEFIGSKTVMVTGGGGSIGSELARQIAAFQPERVLIVERAEPSLFTVHHELSKKFDGIEFCPLIADISDKARMTQIFDELGKIVPVTVIKAGPCIITQIKTVLTDGYNAVQIGYFTVKPKL